MEASNKVLSQAEIDAMFSAVDGGSGGPPDDAPEHPVGPRPEPPIREAESGAMTTESIGKRLEKLEETLVKMGRQEGTPADLSAAVKQAQQDIQGDRMKHAA